MTLLLWNADRRLPREATAAFAAALAAGRPPRLADAATLLGRAARRRHRPSPAPAGCSRTLLRGALGCLLVAAIFWAMATPRLPVGIFADADSVARFAGAAGRSAASCRLAGRLGGRGRHRPAAPRIARARHGRRARLHGARPRHPARGAGRRHRRHLRALRPRGGQLRRLVAHGARRDPRDAGRRARLAGLSGIYVWAALSAASRWRWCCWPALSAGHRPASLAAARAASGRSATARCAPSGPSSASSPGAAPLTLSIVLGAARAAGL